MGTSKSKVQSKDKKLHTKHKLLIIGGSILVLIVATYCLFQLTPLPGVALIRFVFDREGHKTLVALEKHSPSTPITVLSDQQYQDDNKKALLDVYIPQHTNQALPTIVWTHGGAWVAGDKRGASPYFKLIASQGYTVVSINYTLAPQKKYPTQLFELNQAHEYIVANAARFQIDPNKIFLSGDSAGANLSSQMAALITNPDYAQELAMKPALAPSQLAGVILFCGIYDMEGLTEANPNLPKLISWGDDQVVWAYSGSRSKKGPIIRQMSPYHYVTKDFPATFISGGNGDPLTKKQSMPLASKLTSLGVPVTTLFYEDNHTPSLPHEYQFNLDNTDGQQALNQMLDFAQLHAQ